MQSDEIQREDRGDVTILHVPVRLDTFSNEALDRRCKELTREGRFKVVVDCSQLKFINSAAIVKLLAFHQEALERGGDLKFANVSTRVQDILELARLDRIFSWHTSVEEAITAF